MKRKVTLLIGSFVTLLLAFLVYHFSTGPVPQNRIDPNQLAHRPQLIPTMPKPVANIDSEGQGMEFNKIDKDGRLEATVRLPKWNKQEDGSYLVQEPNFVLYHKGGERTYIRADRGELVIEEMGHNVDIRSGKLSGNVRIRLDRGVEADPFRTPMEQRMEQVVRIDTDELNFDNDRLLMYTDSHLTVLSDMGDIYGRGLTIRWRDNPRELLNLEVTHGELMKVYKIPANMLPGAAAGGPSIVYDAPAPRLEAEPWAWSSGRMPVTVGGPVPDAAIGGKKRPGDATTGPAAVKRNIYQATFKERVHVDYPIVDKDGHASTGFIQDADVLQLVFDWEQDKDPNGRKKDKAGASPSAAPHAVVAAPAVAAPVVAAPAVAGPAATTAGATTAPDIKAGIDANSPMIITWTGPLTLIPIGHTDTPSSKNYQITAEGERVVLSDARSVARCKKFMYHSSPSADPNVASQEGYLQGDAKSPARLIVSDGQQAVCEQMSFNRGAGIVQMAGAGHMTRMPRFAELGDLLAAIQRDDEPASMPGDANAPADQISWTQSMQATLAAEPSRAKGRGDTRQTVQDANFVGRVHLVQGGSSDYVISEGLFVQMGKTDDGRSYARMAIATGGVVAQQKTAEITAVRAVVNFVPRAAGAPAVATTQGARPGVRGTGLDTQARIQASTVQAEGNVVVIDRGGAEPFEAHADKMTGDLIARTAVLYGAPARAKNGTNELCGATIYFNEIRQAGSPPQQTAQVTGAGTINFMVNRDLNGVALAKSRPLVIAWDKSMVYDSGKYEADFDGNVVLNSQSADPNEIGTDHMDCKRMQVLFERPGAATATQPVVGLLAGPLAGPGKKLPSTTGPIDLESLAPTTSPAVATSAPADASALGKAVFGMSDYGRRRISEIHAENGVVMNSYRQSTADRSLLRRMEVTGDKMVYNAATGETVVSGKGTLLNEDYRPPVARAPETTKPAATPKPGMEFGASADNVQRPFLVGFTWDQSMTLTQKDRTVVFDGNAVMAYRSGMYVPRKPGLVLPAWGDLKNGRVTWLMGNKLSATFAPPDPNSGRSSGEGPQLGPLDRLLAVSDTIGGVSLEDGIRQKREAICQRLDYDRSLDMIWLQGSLPGQPKTEAKLVSKDLDTNKSQTFSGIDIKWFRHNDRVVVDGATGGGIR